MQVIRSIRLVNRDLEFRLSKAARAALAELNSPLVVEMELFFSCLIRKRVRFLTVAHPGAMCVSVDAHLMICFRPVMTRKCGLSEEEGQPQLDTFPIQRPEAFVPKWLTVDFRHGNWSGEFGF